MIPVSEIPRTYLLFCERYLVNKVVPGSRVTVVGIQYIDEHNSNSNTNNINTKRNSYIKVSQFTTEANELVVRCLLAQATIKLNLAR